MATTDFSARVQADALFYKIYTALLTQSGTNDPNVIVLQNTTGAIITFQRFGVGDYQCLSDLSIFVTNKTFVNCQLIHSSVFGTGTNPMFLNDTQQNNATALQLYTYNDTFGGALTDGLLLHTFIEIRVYP